MSDISAVPALTDRDIESIRAVEADARANGWLTGANWIRDLLADRDRLQRDNERLTAVIAKARQIHASECIACDYDLAECEMGSVLSAVGEGDQP